MSPVDGKMRATSGLTKNTVGALFEDEPRRWGLRGDPYLWRAMQEHLATVPLPANTGGLVRTVATAFLELTGTPMHSDSQVVVERFARGGMSSGAIDATFWRDEALRLLVDRAWMLTAHTPNEKFLDRALEQALWNYSAFARWFLSRTKFGESFQCVSWSRSDHPWGVVRLKIADDTGVTHCRRFEGETDLLVVFEKVDRSRAALHIENKLANGRFRPHQPEMYRARAAVWERNQKYGNYGDWQTVLVAPSSFIKQFNASALKFDVVIAHEDIAAYLPEFRGGR